MVLSTLNIYYVILLAPTYENYMKYELTCRYYRQITSRFKINLRWSDQKGKLFSFLNIGGCTSFFDVNFKIYNDITCLYSVRHILNSRVIKQKWFTNFLQTNKWTRKIYCIKCFWNLKYCLIRHISLRLI